MMKKFFLMAVLLVGATNFSHASNCYDRQSDDFRSMSTSISPRPCKYCGNSEPHNSCFQSAVAHAKSLKQSMEAERRNKEDLERAMSCLTFKPDAEKLQINFDVPKYVAKLQINFDVPNIDCDPVHIKFDVPKADLKFNADDAGSRFEATMARFKVQINKLYDKVPLQNPETEKDK
jgi:hypothetical protein